MMMKEIEFPFILVIPFDSNISPMKKTSGQGSHLIEEIITSAGGDLVTIGDDVSYSTLFILPDYWNSDGDVSSLSRGLLKGKD